MPLLTIRYFLFRYLSNFNFLFKSKTQEFLHLTLLPHIVSLQVKAGGCYITGQWVVSSE